MTDESRKNTYDEMIEVIKASKSGEKTKSRLIGTNEWRREKVRNGFNFDDYQYRIAPRKPSVDWSHVSDWVVAIARNETGRTFAFNAIPRRREKHWRASPLDLARHAEAIASYDPGTCDWTESLIVRPGHEEGGE